MAELLLHADVTPFAELLAPATRPWALRCLSWFLKPRWGSHVRMCDEESGRELRLRRPAEQF